MPRPDFLIVGLGNPGPPYEGTRHNIGAALVEELSRKHGIPLLHRKYHSLVGQGTIAARRCLLALPQTYMNLSGTAVARMMSFTEAPPGRLLVAHDDLDLPLGKIRLRRGGGSGGHRGVASLIESIGDAGFLRLKLGIGRPPPGRKAESYVLERFAAGERQTVAAALELALEAVVALLTAGPEKAMSLFNAER